jgi:hypothetical protein
METTNKAVTLERRELRFTLPKVLLDTFVAEPRFVLEKLPSGLWPVDVRAFQNVEFVKKLAADRDFIKNFEIVIMPKM